MKKIWSIFDKPTKIEFIFLTVMLTFNTVLETISISLLIPIIVSLTENNLFELYPKVSIFINYFQEIFSTNIINVSLILFAITIIFKNLFQTYINYKEANLNMKVQEVTSQRLFNAFLSRSYNFHLKQNSADLITKIRNETRYFSQCVFSIITILSDFILISGISILLLFLFFKLTLITIFFSTLFSYIFLKIFKSFINKSAKKRRDIDFSKTQMLQESIQGIREIILSNMSKNILDSYKIISNNYVKYLTFTTMLKKLPKVYFEFLILLALIVIVFVALNYFQFNKSQIILPTISLFAASAFKVLPAVNRIVGSIQSYKFSFPAVLSVYDELKHKDQILPPPKKYKIDELHLNDISFSYPNTSKKIFSNLNLTIKSGDKILIIGESGVGKSTFLDILVGLQKPKKGKIIINGTTTIDESQNLTNSLSYVSQKIFLFNKSLKFNVTLSDENYDQSKFEKAIKTANLEDLISKLKNGFDTNLGESGSILSGGQKQRIMIARALYKSDNFLIMDEPTSSLDSEMSNFIIKPLIDKKNLTLIMVSHNKDFKQLFKKVLKIEDSNILEE